MPASLAFVGSYTAPLHGKGIVVFRYESATNTFQPRRTEDSPNPSFLCLSPDRKTLFAVNEHWKEGEVSSFRVEAETGALTFLGKQSTQGGSPCHLCTDPAGKWLFVANHNDGSLAMFPIEEGGRLGEVCQRIQHEGNTPHAHFVGFDPTGQFLLCVDKGIDKVMVYRISGGKLVPHDPPFVALKPGTAPRHLAFHPNGHFA